MRSEASQDAIDIYDMFLTMVEDMKQKTRDGTAEKDVEYNEYIGYIGYRGYYC